MIGQSLMKQGAKVAFGLSALFFCFFLFGEYSPRSARSFCGAGFHQTLLMGNWMTYT